MYMYIELYHIATTGETTLAGMLHYGIRVARFPILSATFSRNAPTSVERKLASWGAIFVHPCVFPAGQKSRPTTLRSLSRPSGGRVVQYRNDRRRVRGEHTKKRAHVAHAHPHSCTTCLSPTQPAAGLEPSFRRVFYGARSRGTGEVQIRR